MPEPFRGEYLTNLFTLLQQSNCVAHGVGDHEDNLMSSRSSTLPSVMSGLSSSLSLSTSCRSRWFWSRADASSQTSLLCASTNEVTRSRTATRLEHCRLLLTTAPSSADSSSSDGHSVEPLSIIRRAFSTDVTYSTKTFLSLF